MKTETSSLTKKTGMEKKETKKVHMEGSHKNMGRTKTNRQ